MHLTRGYHSSHVFSGTFTAIRITPLGRAEAVTFHAGYPIAEWGHMNYYEVLNDGTATFCLVYQPPNIKRGSINQWYKSRVGTIGVSIRGSIYIVPTQAIHEIWRGLPSGWVNPQFERMPDFVQKLQDHFRWKYYDGVKHAREVDLQEFYRKQYEKKGYVLKLDFNTGLYESLGLIEETPWHEQQDQPPNSELARELKDAREFRQAHHEALEEARIRGRTEATVDLESINLFEQDPTDEDMGFTLEQAEAILNEMDDETELVAPVSLDVTPCTLVG